VKLIGIVIKRTTITLAAGSYTAIVRGARGASGTALVEVHSIAE